MCTKTLGQIEKEKCTRAAVSANIPVLALNYVICVMLGCAVWSGPTPWQSADF